MLGRENKYKPARSGAKIILDFSGRMNCMIIKDNTFDIARMILIIQYF